MKNEVVERIQIDAIVPDPRNRRHGAKTPEDLEGLASSIKTYGVQEPAIVRALKDQPGTYMLVAGERRWRASQLAGADFLPCIVRDLEEPQALAIQLIENLHRQDLHPLDEAEGYDRLQTEAGYTVDLIAQEIGRSPAYVYQRLRLQKLIPQARTLLEDGKISTAIALLLARLPEAQQTLVYKANLENQWSLENITASKIEWWIRQNLICDLAAAAWKLADENLVKKAGSCANCAKKTGATPGLFEDEGPQKCLDPACYKVKQKALVKKNLEGLEGTEFLKVKNDWGSAIQAEGALSPHEWKECKKKDEGAMRAIVVSGASPGKLIWARKVEAGSAFGERDDNPGYERWQADRKAKEEKVLAAKTKINLQLFEAVLAAADREEPLTLLRSIVVECVTGIRGSAALARYLKLEPVSGIEDEDEGLSSALNSYIQRQELKGLVRILIAGEISNALEICSWSSVVDIRLEKRLELYHIESAPVIKAVSEEYGVDFEAEDDDCYDEDEDDDTEAESEEEEEAGDE